MSGKYDAIIDLPHPVSKHHPHMSASNRAAQFSPFAALTGYDGAVQETARLTTRREELTEDAQALLDEKLQCLREQTHRSERPVITVTYFQPDERKEGGSYETRTGALKKIDEQARLLVFGDGTAIPVSEITELQTGMEEI